MGQNMTPEEVAIRLAMDGAHVVAMPSELWTALAVKYDLAPWKVFEIVWQAEAYIADKDYADWCAENGVPCPRGTLEQ
jgi:hypothetical protein